MKSWETHFINDCQFSSSPQLRQYYSENMFVPQKRVRLHLKQTFPNAQKPIFQRQPLFAKCALFILVSISVCNQMQSKS